MRVHQRAPLSRLRASRSVCRRPVVHVGSSFCRLGRGWSCPFTLRCIEKYTFSILTKFDAGTKSNQDIVFVETQPGIHHVQKTFPRAQRHPICKVVTLYKNPTLFSHKVTEELVPFRRQFFSNSVVDNSPFPPSSSFLKF